MDDTRHEQKAADWFGQITGRSTRTLDDGVQNGVADLAVLDADGAYLGAMEVTRYVNEEYRGLLAAMNKRLGDGWQLNLDGLAWEWMVFLERQDARIAGLEAPLLSLLRELEAVGQRDVRFEAWQAEIWARRLGSPLPSAHQIAVDAIEVGIGAAHAFREDTPGRVWVSPPGSVSILDGEHVEDAVASEAHKPDNIRKLADAGGERHLWIWIEQWHPAWSMEEGSPPPRPAELPETIDRVWAATHSGAVWSASKVDHWRVDRVAEKPRPITE